MQTIHDYLPWPFSSDSLDEQDIFVEISGTGNEKVDGPYMCKPSDWHAGDAPSFRNSRYGRCLFFDVENRWRVGLARHSRQRTGRGAGYMRSNPVVKGILPTAKFLLWEVWSEEERDWLPCDSVIVIGVQTPEKFMALHRSLENAIQEQNGRILITRINLAGTQLGSLQLDIEIDHVAEMRTPQCNLLMPDGRLLTESDDELPLLFIIGGFVDFASLSIKFDVVDLPYQ